MRNRRFNVLCGELALQQRKNSVSGNQPGDIQFLSDFASLLKDLASVTFSGRSKFLYDRFRQAEEIWQLGSCT
jgi:hypothetical protein